MLFVSFICYGTVASISLVFGIIYLIRSQFMPYHSLALGKPWSEVEPNIQILILALMRVAGAGFIATAIAVTILLCFPFKAGEQWAIYGIFSICACTSLGSSYATFLVQNQTPGNPPLKLSLVTILLTEEACGTRFRKGKSRC